MSIFLLHSTWRRETTTTTTTTMTTRRHHQRLNLTRSACPHLLASLCLIVHIQPVVTVSFGFQCLSLRCSACCACSARSVCLSLSNCRFVCLSVCHWVCLFKCNIYFMDCCYIFSSTFNPKTERINFPSISIHRRSREWDRGGREAGAGAQLCEPLTDVALHNFAPF